MLEPSSPAYPETRLSKVVPARPLLRQGVLLSCILAGLGTGLLLSNLSAVFVYPVVAGSSCQADTLLVMGAAQYNGTPSPAFQRRLDKAKQLYDAGCASSVLITGGRRAGDTFSEGEVGASYLQEQGIPRAALMSETKSRTSHQNLLYSQDLLSDNALTIVTDDMHAYRTRYLANRLGYRAELEPVYAPFGRFSYFMNEVSKLSVQRLGLF